MGAVAWLRRCGKMTIIAMDKIQWVGPGIYTNVALGS
jgi:succinyl-CoA synthetase alpha subunit